MSRSDRQRIARRASLVAIAVFALIAPATVGCGGGDFGAELAARPEPLPIAAESAQPIRLPGETGYSITLAPAQKAPGLNGAAEVSATADKTGRASAEARVKNGGTASAGFQLGHSFRNASDRQIDLDVSVSADVAYAARSTPSDGVSHANIELTLFAQNQRNLTLARMPLVRHGTEDGNAESDETRRITLTVTLSPGDTAMIYLAGQARIDTQEGQTASGSITVENLKMELTPRPAPAVRTTADESG
ncbi:MAG: hypothetical protein D6744_18830 [Planctomycetota bacterium]|nr:MAG: hypothetical protein D6744_18830 [Planctomycetota bacterium]